MSIKISETTPRKHWLEYRLYTTSYMLLSDRIPAYTAASHIPLPDRIPAFIPQLFKYCYLTGFPPLYHSFLNTAVYLDSLQILFQKLLLLPNLLHLSIHFTLNLRNLIHPGILHLLLLGLLLLP